MHYNSFSVEDHHDSGMIFFYFSVSFSVCRYVVLKTQINLGKQSK